MNTTHGNTYMVQAWAFACAVRKILEKSPPMNMNSFPKEIWILHRRLHHRFLKQKDHVSTVTHNLTEYKKRLQTQNATAASKSTASAPATAAAASKSSALNVLCLLSESSEDDSETESDE